MHASYGLWRWRFLLHPLDTTTPARVRGSALGGLFLLFTLPTHHLLVWHVAAEDVQSAAYGEVDLAATDPLDTLQVVHGADTTCVRHRDGAGLGKEPDLLW